MTTAVTIKATCGDENEVVIALANDKAVIEQEIILQNGEERTEYVHLTRGLFVSERKKAKPE